MEQFKFTTVKGTTISGTPEGKELSKILRSTTIKDQREVNHQYCNGSYLTFKNVGLRVFPVYFVGYKLSDDQTWNFTAEVVM